MGTRRLFMPLLRHKALYKLQLFATTSLFKVNYSIDLRLAKLGAFLLAFLSHLTINTQVEYLNFSAVIYFIRLGPGYVGAESRYVSKFTIKFGIS